MALVPQLFVQDLDNAAEFYRDLLGFELQWTDEVYFPGNPGLVRSASLQHANEIILLSETAQAEQAPNAAPNHGRGHLYLYRPDLDEYFEHLKDWVEIVAVRTFADGLLQFTVADPDGHWLTIAEVVNEFDTVNRREQAPTSPC